MKLQQRKLVSNGAMKINMRNPFVQLVPIVLTMLVLVSLSGCGGGGDTASDDHAFAVAIQSDGKVIAAGDSYSGNNGWSFALVRYNSNGSLDTSFGAGGKVLTIIGAGARAVAIQSDGKIVAAGYSYISPNNFVLSRYNSDGSLDTTFGAGGVLLTDMGGGASALAIQSDGKIVAAGYSYTGYGYDFALARYDSNGMLDATFGFGSGKVFAMGGVMGGGASSVAIQADGKIVAAGGSALIRCNSDGSLDTTFGGGHGMVTTNPYYEQTSGVAIQPDGQILAAGSSYNNGAGSYDLALTRYNGDGSFDTAFASNGSAITTAMSLYPLSSAKVVPDPLSGKIVAAGYSQYLFVLARYNSNGSPDTSFASGGAILTTGSVYWSNDSVVHDSAVQSDNKIVLAGSSYKDDVNGYDFALARLNSDGSLDTSFGTGGQVTTGM